MGYTVSTWTSSLPSHSGEKGANYTEDAFLSLNEHLDTCQIATMSLKCIVMSIFVVTGTQCFFLFVLTPRRAYFLSAFFEKRVTESKANFHEHDTPQCG